MSITVVNAEVGESNFKGAGKGLFAMEHIEKGKLIGVFDGEVVRVNVRSQSTNSLPPEIEEQAIDLLLEDDWLYMMIPIKSIKLSGIDYINHSCTPNCEVVDKIKVYAKREILPGEELTIDYSSWNIVPEGKQCRCRKNCPTII